MAARFTDFVEAATSSLDLAIYDFRLQDDDLVSAVVGALTDAARRGVTVRIAYDAGKPVAATARTFARLAADPAPLGTAEWVTQHFQGTDVQTKAIAAGSGQLMHSKYIVRDAATAGGTAGVWTGSTNFTDDAWTLQENNIVTVASPTVAVAYSTDFGELWTAGAIKGTGAGDTGAIRAGRAMVGWDFAPGDGKEIDTALAASITGASERVVLAVMVLTSPAVLIALVAALDRGLPISGIYDSGQMGPIEKEWAASSHSATVLADWQRVKATLVAKRSAPYTPTGPHDFMHNKVLIADSALVTGSYNFSANAERNAENQLHITHAASLLDAYSDYVLTISDVYR